MAQNAMWAGCTAYAGVPPWGSVCVPWLVQWGPHNFITTKKYSGWKSFGLLSICLLVHWFEWGPLDLRDRWRFAIYHPVLAGANKGILRLPACIHWPKLVAAPIYSVMIKRSLHICNNNSRCIWSLINFPKGTCMTSTVASPVHEALESTIHGLVEEFFEMLGDVEAWHNSLDVFETCRVVVDSTVSSTHLPQVQMRRIQSLLCSDLNSLKYLETHIRKS